MQDRLAREMRSVDNEAQGTLWIAKTQTCAESSLAAAAAGWHWHQETSANSVSRMLATRSYSWQNRTSIEAACKKDVQQK